MLLENSALQGRVEQTEKWTSEPSRSQALWAALSLATASTLALVARQNAADPSHEVVWLALALATYSLALLSTIAACSRGVGGLGLSEWRLGPWFLLWYALAYGLATTAWVHPPALATVASEIALSSVIHALWLTLLGLTAWACGYLAGLGKTLAVAGRRGVQVLSRHFTVEVRSLWTPWIVYGLGTAARGADALASGRFGYSGQTASAVTSAGGFDEILGVLSYLPVCAVLAAGLQVFHERRRRARLTLIVLTVAELIVATASADKSNFFNLALAIIIPYATAKRRLPKFWMASGLALLLVVIVPFTATFRSVIDSRRGVLTASQSIAVVPSIMRQVFSLGNTIGALPQSIGYLTSRIQEIDSVAIIVQRTPAQIGYQSPIILLEYPLEGFIPRLVWPGKPLHLSMQQVSQEYYNIPSNSNNAASVTPIGDLYRYGGLPVVFIGMLILGAWLRFLDEAIDVRQNRHAGILLVVIVWTNIIGEAGWLQIFSDIPVLAGFWVLAVSLIFRRRSAE